MNPFSRFDRIILLVMGLLALILGGVWGAWQWLGIPTPGPDRSERMIGARGPLGVRFGIGVDETSAQKHIHFDPPLVGTYTWAGDTAYFWPYQPLAAGQVIRLSVDAGVQTRDGRSTRREAAWEVQVRPPELVYLSPSRGPELWRADASGGTPRQLTSTGGRVFDYDVSPDGESLVYSAYDDQGEISLWRVDREGSGVSRMLDCGADWCINPAISPDGRQLAYVRKQAGASEGSSPGVGRIWTMDLATLQTDRLYANPNIGGSEPIWSPDGRYLAFFDGISNGLRLANLVTHQDNLLPSEMGMTARWAPDGLSLVFTNITLEETFAYESVFRFSVPTQQVALAFGADAMPLDYSLVSFSTDGQWLVVGIREVAGNPARQMWLMKPDGSQRQQITQDPLVNVGAFAWSPGGSQVLFQSLALGSSAATPQVSLWDRLTGEIRPVAEDATRAAWIP